MFNGIVYNKGFIKSFIKKKNSLIIEIITDLTFTKKDIGTSINCNGVCLTLTKIKKKSLFFYISPETLKKTNYKNIKINDHINLEKSLYYGQNISGHYTQGHIDTIGNVKAISIIDNSWLIKFSIPVKFKKFLIYKGSININGVSLTISKINKTGFEITVIPHTLNLTNLMNLKKNNIVNIEFDIFSKYIIDLNK
jgi:riboflavin synthase|tara:strand:- start:59 stop:643 length:585 start_codon:yes stop_codon:yes gene_type:complete